MTATASESQVQPPAKQGIGTAIALSAAFALCGMVPALRDFAVQVLPHILMPRDVSRFQEITDGSPIPQVLNWNTHLIDFFVLLREPNPVLGIVVTLGLAIVGWMIAIALVNPTFRPISAKAPAETEAANAAQPFTKAFRILLRLIVPTAILWALAGRFFPEDWAFGIQAIGLIFALFVGYRRDGMAGDFASPEFTKTPIPVVRLMLWSIVTGIVVGWLHSALLHDLEPTLLVYQTLGTFHQGYLREIGGAWFGMTAAFWFTVAMILVGVSLSRTGVLPRIVLTLLGILGFAVMHLFQAFLHPSLLQKSFYINNEVLDAIAFPYTPGRAHGGIPTGIQGARALADWLDLPFRDPDKEPPQHNLFLFERRTLFSGLSTLTDDGQAADDATVQKIADYYRQSHGRTGLNWSAMRWQLSAASSQWDTSRVLELALQDLTTAPHVSKTGGYVREIFFTCAATQRNHQALDKLADERKFAFPDRDSLRMMGDFYRRFGDKDKALSWYRRAEMPQSFLKARQEEKPMFRQGTVKGKITLDGKPLAGARVAVLPRRLNGLARDMEGGLFNAMGELAPRYGSHDWVRSSAAFRWFSTSAVTDANGNFEMHDLTEGEYAFVCTLSPVSAPKRYDEQTLNVKRAPTPFVLNYKAPTTDLGTLAFRTGKAASKP